jgi:tetraacyldisaccharide 4'-kinase
LTPRPWLAPLGLAYGGAAALRAAAYAGGLLPRTRLRGVVISVGNLRVGGSGKTPVVARLAALLRERGVPLAVLSRGYAGSFRGEALIVSDGERILAGAEEAGDEPVMLARSLPGVVVAVGRRRDRVGRHVEERFGTRVHLLDDGFQHLRLFRDLDLLCVDAVDPGARPLPAGPLRELPAAAARADLVLLTQADRAAPERLALLEGRHGPGRTLRVRRRLAGFTALDGSPRRVPRRPFLLAGIARPERFARDVRELAGEVSGARLFPDHHRFRPSELAEVLAAARAAGADAVVTTAKDAVRLSGQDGDLPVLVLGIAAEFEDEAPLRRRLAALVPEAA